MAEPGLILVTGAGGSAGGVGVGNKVVALLRERGRPVRAMVHHDDGRADALRGARRGGRRRRPHAAGRCRGGPRLGPTDVLQHQPFAVVARSRGHSCDRGPCRRPLGCTRRHLPDDRVADGRARARASPTISGCIFCRSRCSTGPAFRSYTFARRSSWTLGCSRPWPRAPSPTAAPSGCPFGTGRTSPIASDDVARVVATVLIDPAPYIGRALELTGPRSQDMNGVAAEYARALGRPISYVDVPWETWAEQVLARANLGPYVDEHIATMARLHRENRYDRVTDTVEEITGRPAESIEEFVRRRKDLFAGAA